MENGRNISVVIVDQNLDHRGALTNAAFVIGLSAGRSMPQDTFGPDVADGDGSIHRSLTNIGHFVRKAGQSKIRTLRAEFAENPLVQVIDYTEDAAPSDYNEYSASLRLKRAAELSYRAIHVFGPEDVIVPRTKNLSRLE